ncbi:MAG: AmmeMemoRadiSam system protein B [Candidatus Hydrogenedens sp.]|nr:AmmeMemoRadiSam system protein B [Candidatus Hydrogenedens sp.]
MQFSRAVLIVLAGLALCAPAHAVGDRLRLPAAAGTYYPEDPYTLQESVNRYIGNASAPALPGRLVACVVPYSPYGLAGEVIGAAFKHLETGQYDRVVIVAPPTNQELRGASVPDVDAYATPLGWVPIDTAAVKKLAFSPLIQTTGVNYQSRSGGVHQKNASIEVILPFLQQKLGLFRLVPLVVGDMFEGDPRLSSQRFSVLADALREVVDDRTLIVVCAHFTYYGEVFGYAPFGNEAAEGVRKLDMDLVDFVMKQDGAAMEDELARTRNIMHGRSGLHVLMDLLSDDLKGTMVAYDTTGRITGRWENSISFASILFTDPNAPANTAHPERALEAKTPNSPSIVEKAPESEPAEESVPAPEPETQP